MIKNKLVKFNLEVSKIALGTVQFGLDYGFTKKKSQEEVNAILKCALKRNINLIDTAREYGDSEKKIGNFLTNYKNDFIIATKLKVYNDLKDLSYNSLKNHINTSVEESLEDLNLNKIPILQLHQTIELIFNNSDFWTIINELKDDKLIDSFGVSVYEINETEFIIKNFHNSVDFFQIPYNIFDRRFENIQDLLNKYSIDLISRSTFLKGIIPCSIETLPNELEDIKPYKIQLKRLANSLNMDSAEIATLFVYYNDYIKSTIFGVDSPKELENNVKTIDKFNKDIFTNVDLDKVNIKDLNLIDPRKWPNF